MTAFQYGDSGGLVWREKGLTGEIRPVTRMEQRIGEAQKLGMSDMIIPEGNLKGIDTTKLTIGLHQAAKVADAFRILFWLGSHFK